MLHAIEALFDNLHESPTVGFTQVPSTLLYEGSHRDEVNAAPDVVIWNQDTLVPHRSFQGRLCGQLYAAMKYLPNGFELWDEYLPEARYSYIATRFKPCVARTSFITLSMLQQLHPFVCLVPFYHHAVRINNGVTRVSF